MKFEKNKILGIMIILLILILVGCNSSEQKKNIEINNTPNPEYTQNQNNEGNISGLSGEETKAPGLNYVLITPSPVGTFVPNVSTEIISFDPQTTETPTYTAAPHVHSWVNATCTSPMYCSICGETQGEALGHEWSEANYDSPSTCLRCGLTRGEAVEKEYKSNTILIYMIGSDLESIQGRATTDINEMLAANNCSSTNIVIQSGGTKNWKNVWMTDGATQRFTVSENDLQLMETLDGNNMTEASSLENFISWGTANYPADRYILLLWDHGDGTLRGFGRDELNGNKTMRLSVIQDALTNSSIKFELVIFDACLMATLETAYALRNNAKYMIASEELLPACGLYYTSWLNTLKKNPSIGNEPLAKMIVDFSVVHAGVEANIETTLSVVKLNKIPEVYNALISMISNIKEEEMAGFWQNITASKVFGSVDGGYDQFDLQKVMETVNIEGADVVISAVKSAVVYSRNSTSVTYASGLAFYAPRDHGEQYASVREDVINCGYSESYFKLFDIFVG